MGLDFFDFFLRFCFDKKKKKNQWRKSNLNFANKKEEKKGEQGEMEEKMCWGVRRRGRGCQSQS